MTEKEQGRPYFLKGVRSPVNGAIIRKHSRTKKKFCFMKSGVQDVLCAHWNARNVQFLLKMKKHLQIRQSVPAVKHV